MSWLDGIIKGTKLIEASARNLFSPIDSVLDGFVALPDRYAVVLFTEYKLKFFLIKETF